MSVVSYFGAVARFFGMNLFMNLLASNTAVIYLHRLQRYPLDKKKEWKLGYIVDVPHKYIFFFIYFRMAIRW